MLTVCRCLASVRSAVWYRSTTQTDQTSSIASGFHCFFTSGINTRFCLFVGYTFSVLLCAAGSDIQACCQLLECTCCRPTPVMESLTTSGSKNSLMPIFLVSWSWSEVLVLFSVLKATILVLCLETSTVYRHCSLLILMIIFHLHLCAVYIETCWQIHFMHRDTKKLKSLRSICYLNDRAVLLRCKAWFCASVMTAAAPAGRCRHAVIYHVGL